MTTETSGRVVAVSAPRAAVAALRDVEKELEPRFDPAAAETSASAARERASALSAPLAQAGASRSSCGAARTSRRITSPLRVRVERAGDVRDVRPHACDVGGIQPTFPVGDVLRARTPE